MGKGGGVPQTTAGAPPPPTLSTLEIQQAKIDSMRQSKARKGINSTILRGQRPLAEGQTQTQPRAEGLGDASAAGSAANSKTALLGGG